MLAPVRLATIHPALVHLALGGLPLVLLAYAYSRYRRSVEWAFVGDVGLLLTTAAALPTFASGLLSNAIVPWPGGLELWRVLHLVGGAALTLVLVITSIVRLRAWRKRGAASSALLGVAVLIAGLGAATGWVGGDVLVFHSGMAVRAAGEGALAPPISDTVHPHDFLDAMRQARASWGGINARLASMLVQHPSDEGYALIEREAKRLEQLASYMADHPPKGVRDPDLITSMAQVLGGDASSIGDAAKAHKLQDIAHALGEASGHCADCHERARWP